MENIVKGVKERDDKLMTYEQFCNHLIQLLNAGLISKTTYSRLIEKKGRTNVEYQYLYNSIQRGC